MFFQNLGAYENILEISHRLLPCWVIIKFYQEGFLFSTRLEWTTFFSTILVLFSFRGKKSLILEKIANDLNTTSIEVGKKMKGLRTYWGVVKNGRIGVSGQAAKKAVKWVWYDSLSFLDQRIIRRPTHDEEANQTENDTPGENRPKSSSNIPGENRARFSGKRKKADDQQSRHNDLFEKFIHTVEKDVATPLPQAPPPVETPATEDKHFGMMVTTRLSSIPECNRKDQVKIEILGALLKCTSDIRDMDIN